MSTLPANNDITADLLLEVFDEPICIHQCLIRLTGSITAALMLTQANFITLDLPAEAGGWFYRSIDDWEAELGLSRAEQETARKKLKDLGVLLEQRDGMPARLRFKVDGRRLLQLLKLQAKTNFGERGTVTEERTPITAAG